MPSPPDPRPQRPGITQYGEATSGNIVVFTGNGGIEDSGFTPGGTVSSGGALVEDSIAVTSGGTFGTTVSAGGAITGDSLSIASGGVFGTTLSAGGAAAVDSLVVTSGGSMATLTLSALPTSDPSVAGALWTSAGAVLLSAG